MTFTVEVALADRPPQTASAATKRAAERAAACQMLQRIAEDGHERA
jgi:dsRNA-specific ribonuclease